MFGWFSEARAWPRAETARAARCRRRTTSGRILIATARSSFVSARAVDFPHAAGADSGGDFIGTEPRARGQRHREPLGLYGDATCAVEG